MFMMNNLVRSWQFLIQCARFFKDNIDLLFFPIISLVLSILLLFILLAGGLLEINFIADFFKNHLFLAIGTFAILYFLFAFLIVFFNTSLIACATERLQGKPASVGDGISLAISHWWPLLQWTLLNTSVGIILRMLERSHSLIEDIITGLIGFGWTISTYFVIPVMVFENVGPFRAIKRGFSLFGRGWRRMLSIFLIFNLFAIALFAALYGLQHLLPGETKEFIKIGFSLFFILILLSATLGSAFNGIINSALYLTYAQNKEPIGFESNLLKQAFAKSRI